MAKHNNTPEKPKMAPEEALFQAYKKIAGQMSGQGRRADHGQAR